jgi:hypothetical protein
MIGLVALKRPYTFVGRRRYGTQYRRCASIDAGSTGGPALFEVSDLRTVRIYMQVPQAFSGQFHPGQKATLEMPQYPVKLFAAVFMSISYAMNPTSPSTLVQLQADNPDGKFFAGAYCQVHVPLASDPDMVRVPPRDADGLSASGRRRGLCASVWALQQFLVELLHDLRLAPLLLRARSDAVGPFGALDLGFGRLVVEAAPYVADACRRFVWCRCLSRKGGPSGKNERADQGYCCSQNGCAGQVSRWLARRPTFSWIRAGHGEALADSGSEIASVRVSATE